MAFNTLRQTVVFDDLYSDEKAFNIPFLLGFVSVGSLYTVCCKIVSYISHVVSMASVFRYSL